MTLRHYIENYQPYTSKEASDKALILKCMDTYADVLTRDNSACHFTASCWITNKARNKILMVHHNIYKSWSWIGGHADGEADLYEVALREAKEETGICELHPLYDGIFALEVLQVASHMKKGKLVSEHLHLDCCYLFEADEAQALRCKENENSGVKWVDIDAVEDISNEEQIKPIYAKLNKKLRELEG
ncbi:MAG: NUDIX hydrolase [Faecalimonas sp.]|nr:NUDIX hydrolase [Faecalimonas sp.]